MKPTGKSLSMMKLLMLAGDDGVDEAVELNSSFNVDNFDVTFCPLNNRQASF